MQLSAGEIWRNAHHLAFTNQTGGFLSYRTATTRFHDLRHTYAVAAIQSGDDIKTVQENLGHATAAFTLDVYGHVTARTKQASADHMETFIKSVSAD